MRALRTIAMVAGAVALVATGVGAAAGLGAFGATAGSAAAAAGASTAASAAAIATASTVASVASVVAAAASIGAMLMQKKPGVTGSVNSVTIGANEAVPYGMGRSFYPGSQVHDAGYGGKIGKTHNPFMSKVNIYSAGGPIEGYEEFLVDWQNVSGLTTSGSAVGYYAGWLYADLQLGARPEATALDGPWTAWPGGAGIIPDWGSDYKLSGYAAGLTSYKFDRKGKHWQNGMPVHGPVAKWARVYDWRQDDTFPGGVGSHRWDDEDTFEWDPNVALNAVTYARGRYALDGSGNETARVVGCGYGTAEIDWPAWTAFANVCDANGWQVHGHVFDGPGISLWDNLKRICAAGAAMPVISGGLLSVRFQSPKVALDTVTPADFADGERTAPGMRTWRDRINTIVPKYRSEQNKWEYVQSAAVQIADYVTEDGEPKEQEVTYELVTDKDQAAQLAAYELYGRRELSGIVIPCQPRLWRYRLGEALNVVDPENGVDHLCVIAGVEKDLASATVTLTFETETTAKHVEALAMTGTAPPAPTLIPHGDADQGAWENAGFGDVPTPDAGDWTLEAGGAPSLIITGAAPADSIDNVVFAYRVDGETEWSSASIEPEAVTRKEIPVPAGGVAYEAAVSYLIGGEEGEKLVLGPVTPVVAIIPPFELTATATDSDSVEIRYRQPRTLLLDYSHVLADETAVIGSATQVGADQYGAGGDVVTITEDSIVAGPRSYWAVAFDDDGNDAAVGPVSINVGGFSFAGGVLPAGASLTRSGTGWYFNSSGVLTSAATDTARFDHRWNGTAWVLAGLLAERDSQNRIRNGAAAGSTAGVMGSGGVAPTNWTFAGTGTGLTREIIGTGTEDGLNYIDIRIHGTATNSGLVDLTFEALTQSAAVVSDQFAASIFAKLTGGSLAGMDSIKIGMIEYNASSASLATQLGAAITPTATRQRFESSFTVGQATAAYTRMLLRIDTTVSVACDLTLRLYEPQFELGSGATSPIPTSGAKVTRNADALVLDWATNRHVPDGAMTTRYGFDDASTQDVATTVASGTATVPTTLNRHAILSAQKIS